MIEKHYDYTNTRSTWVDAAKGVAILMVFLTHSGMTELEYPLSMVGDVGRHGTQIFCIVSAYLALVSYSNNCASAEQPKVLKWWKNKIFHLIPLYYIALILGIITKQYEHWYTSVRGVSIQSIIVHLLMINGFSMDYYNSIIRVEWYIGALVIFYLLTPVIYRVINSLEKAVLSFVLIGFSSKFIIHFVTHLDYIKNSENYVGYWSEFSLVSQGPCFIFAA